MPDPGRPGDNGDVPAMQAEIVRLNKIVNALTRRAESATNAQGSDFGLFQTTIMLQEQVRHRTEELEAALRENAKITSDLRTLSAATELERRRLELVLEHTDDAVLLVSARGTVIFSNPAVQRLNEALGVHHPPASLGEFRDLYEIRYADERPMAPDESPLTPVLAGEAVNELELQLSPQAGGEQLTVLFSALPVRDARGAVVQVVVTIRDITERKRSEELLQSTLDALERSHRELLELASHDSLTGLLNRRRFEEEFERQLAEQRRLGRGGALVWLDLDHFKDVNDTLGHRAGDELLMLVARDPAHADATLQRDRPPGRRRVRDAHPRRGAGRGSGGGHAAHRRARRVASSSLPNTPRAWP